MDRYISPGDIDRIAQQADIVQIISEYIPLTKTGKNYKGLCPFHQEKTPSFIVSAEKQVFHCFGCGVGGNAFTFLMKWEKVNFPEAVHILAQKMGVQVSSGDKDAGHKEQFYRINALITEFFNHQLKKNKMAQRYLYERGFKSTTVEDFRLGWAPSSRIFVEFCRTNNLPSDTLRELGLLKISPESGNEYAYFRERLIFPIFSLAGNIVGFGARVLDESLPKYINSPQSPVFDKGKNLYGLHLAREEMRKSKEVILVEGYTDVIALYQEGIHNLVASLGTSLTDPQARTLKRYVNTVHLAYDEDNAGEAATIRGIDLLLEDDLQVKIISLPRGEDPADCVRKGGKEVFLQLKERALPYIDYRIKVAINNNQPLSLDRKLEVVNSLFFTLKKIGSRHILDEALRKLSQAVDFNEDSLRSEFTGFCREKNTFSFSPTMKFRVPEQEEFEKRLLQIMLHSREAVEVVKRNFSPDNFTHPLCRQLAQEILLHQESDITPSYLINRVTDTTLCSLISSLSLDDPSLEGCDLRQIAGDVVQRLKRRFCQMRIKQLRQEAHDYKAQGEEEKAFELDQQVVRLQKSILI